MSKKLTPRTRFFVDKKVQGALVARLVVYWLMCLWAIFALLAGVPIVLGSLFFAEPPSTGRILYDTWIQFWPMLCAALLLLPFVIRDLVRQSHRFAGPLLRIRNTMKQLADGENPAPIKLRKGDYWTDLADEYNRLAAEVTYLRRERQSLLAELAEHEQRMEQAS